MKNIFFGTEKDRMSAMWRLSWPAIIEQVLATMVSYVDTGMVGVLGAAATAAVSVNAASLWLINGILSGVGVGYSVQISHAVGAGDDERVRTVLRQAVLGTVVCGIAALALYQGLAGFIPRWLGAEPEVYPQAVAYLRFYTMAMPFNTAVIVFSAVLRCMGNTKTPLYFNTGANLLNIVLNFFLIYPTRDISLFGSAVRIPGAGLGVEGAAIASAIAIALAGCGMLYSALRQGDRYRVFLRDGLRPNAGVIRQAARLGLPSAAERAAVNLGQIAMTALVGHVLGTVALAANQIATTAEGLCYLPAYGISYAATAMVGQAVGAKNREDAEAYGTLSARLSFFLCVGTGALLFLLAHPLAALFNSDIAVVSQAARVLRIVSVSEPFFALSIVYTGALRGARDVRFPMVLSMGCMWGVRIVLAPVLVFVFHMGLEAVWIAMAADLILRGAGCALRWRSGKWLSRCGLNGPVSVSKAAPCPPASEG